MNRWIPVVLVVCLFQVFPWSAIQAEPKEPLEDYTLLGGNLSSDLKGKDAIQVTAPNIKDSELITTQLSGFAQFHQLFYRKTGLGPNFVNNACRGCHVENGKGPTRLRGNRSRKFSSMIVKVSLGNLDDGRPIEVPGIGSQVLDTGHRFQQRYDIQLLWRRAPGSYPDGTTYTLRRPLITLQVPGIPSKKLAVSLRMSPLLIGGGLLEGISDEDILSRVDPDDEDGDGISGRPNYVLDRRSGEKKIGRFGFKSTQPSLEQQNASAAFNDMGLTNPLFPAVDSSVEFSEDDLRELTLYLALSGVPKARTSTTPTGQSLFSQIGCASCHIPTYVTKDHPLKELSGQTIHPFTDLLLHDMGPDLADSLKQFEAEGTEWRTTPLWGLGFADEVSLVKVRYLHDGRARTIEEAILWHGGEAEKSREAFKKLAVREREALLEFLNSL